MVTPKTIQLFLIDGAANGRIKATLGNWTGVTYLIPRTELSRSKDRNDLNQTGVNLLLGTDDEGVSKVYIGQARVRKNGTGVLGRIAEHIGEDRLEYWTHAIALVTSNDSFGPTEISYLENRFTQMANTAGRYVVANNNDPSPGNVTEEKKAELDEFIDYARLTIGSLGYRLFDAIDDAKSSQAGTSEEPTLYTTYVDADAMGRQTSDGFVILAGSRLRPEDSFPSSCPPAVLRNRARHADKIDADYVVTGDILMNSPSSAANFVGGGSISGTAALKDERGLTLKQLEELDLQQA